MVRGTFRSIVQRLLRGCRRDVCHDLTLYINATSACALLEVVRGGVACCEVRNLLMYSMHFI